jgi:hypothetical protein
VLQGVRNDDSSVGIVTRLQAVSKYRGSSHEMNKTFISFPKGSDLFWGPAMSVGPCRVVMNPRRYVDHHLVPSLIMCVCVWSCTSTPSCTSVASILTTSASRTATQSVDLWLQQSVILTQRPWSYSIQKGSRIFLNSILLLQLYQQVNIAVNPKLVFRRIICYFD